MADRQALHAYLSEDAHSAWQDFAEKNGVSMTGLLEELGEQLGERIEKAGSADEPEAFEPTSWKQVVRGGRRIDAQRRRRGGV